MKLLSVAVIFIVNIYDDEGKIQMSVKSLVYPNGQDLKDYIKLCSYKVGKVILTTEEEYKCV